MVVCENKPKLALGRQVDCSAAQCGRQGRWSRGTGTGAERKLSRAQRKRVDRKPGRRWTEQQVQLLLLQRNKSKRREWNVREAVEKKGGIGRCRGHVCFHFDCYFTYFFQPQMERYWTPAATWREAVRRRVSWPQRISQWAPSLVGYASMAIPPRTQETLICRYERSMRLSRLWRAPRTWHWQWNWTRRDCADPHPST